jgi:hypothetical protein
LLLVVRCACGTSISFVQLDSDAQPEGQDAHVIADVAPPLMPLGFVAYFPATHVPRFWQASVGTFDAVLNEPGLHETQTMRFCATMLPAPHVMQLDCPKFG